MHASYKDLVAWRTMSILGPWEHNILWNMLKLWFTYHLLNCFMTSKNVALCYNVKVYIKKIKS